MKVFHTNREEIVLFTLEEVSKELGISYRTVRRYAAEERFPVCEIGRNKYVWMRHLGQFLKGAKSTKRWKQVEPPKFDTEFYSPAPWDRYSSKEERK